MPRGLKITTNFLSVQGKRAGASAPMKWWHLLLLLWTVGGLAVCSENTPDVVGHSHAHSASHLFAPWHGSPADRVPDDGDKKNPDFHYHLLTDFSAIDSDIPSARHIRLGFIVGCHAHGEDDLLPETPAFDTERPPLIWFRMA